METYGQRVAWLIANLAGGNARELARRAGLKNPGHISVFMQRARGKPSAKLDPETIDLFVTNLGVRRDWLMTGTGDPVDGRVIVHDPTASRAPREPDARTSRKGAGRWERYAERYAAFSAQATVALARGVPEAALDAASDVLGARLGEGPTEVEAWDTIQRYARQITDGAPPGREATDEEFEVPVVRARQRKT